MHMSAKGRKEFLEAVSGNPLVIQYVKLFRVPLFLTVLDEELKKYDESVWENETTVREIAFNALPATLQQFSFPQEEIDQVIDQCVADFALK